MEGLYWEAWMNVATSGVTVDEAKQTAVEIMYNVCSYTNTNCANPEAAHW